MLFNDRKQGDHGPVNLILMISDGYGPASHTFTRSFDQALQHRADDYDFRFPLDSYLVGSHRSRSSDSLITDSAAGATAFACALKTYNGAIGVDHQGRPCATIFEAAKASGYLTGVVVTSRLSDATPAAFFAHTASRASESEIASQLLSSPYDGGKRTIDLAIGGGACWFLPRSDPLSCRTDDRNLVEEAEDAGWDVRIGETLPDDRINQTVVLGPHGEVYRRYSGQRNKRLKKPSLPYLSLLTPGDTPYVIDVSQDAEGRDTFDSLSELSTRALDILSSHAARSPSSFTGVLVKFIEFWTSTSSRKGFMLMIEGSQIDLCQHQNDPSCMAREALAFQEAAGTVLKYVDDLNARGKRTLLIATSDHETGGLTLGRSPPGAPYPDYVYYPERLTAARASAETLSAKLVAYYKSNNKNENSLRQFIKGHILGPEGGLGFGGAPQTGGEISLEEIQLVQDCLFTVSAKTDLTPPIDNNDECRKAIAEVASRRANVGWSTPGHTGVDINVYAHGYGADGLRGNIANTEVSRTKRCRSSLVACSLTDRPSSFDLLLLPDWQLRRKDAQARS